MQNRWTAGLITFFFVGFIQTAHAQPIPPASAPIDGLVSLLLLAGGGALLAAKKTTERGSRQ
jgi:hypothetical protein